MKKFAFLLLMLLALPLVAQAQDIDVTIPIEVQQGTINQAITNSVINLYGPQAEASFYYELDADVADEAYYVQFFIEHSSLLIDPSSVTVLIDNRPIQTVKLAGKTAQEIVVPLAGDALKSGQHEVRVQFAGTITEGVCVDQNSTGNWLTIGINSYIHLPTESTVDTTQISAYPEIYTGRKQHPITIVIPEEASNDSLSGAMQIASYIISISAENSVSIVTDRDVKKITGNMILVGAAQEFNEGWSKDVSSRVELQKDALMLAQHRIKQGDQFVYAFVVTAQQAVTIAQKAQVLTNESAYNQFAGTSLAVAQVPVIRNVQGDTVEFKKMGMQNFTLNKTMTHTPTYYYYVPQAKMDVENPTVDLHFKMSDVITPYKDLDGQQASLLQQQPVELIVLINDIPHAIDLQSVEVDDLGEARVRLPIDQQALQDSHLLSMQLTTNGLRVQNPCVATDNDRWIYVYEDSHFTLPVTDKQQTGEMYFSHFPYPFATSTVEQPLIIVKNDEVTNEELAALYNLLLTNNSLPPITLMSQDEVTDEQLKNGHVLILGNPSALPGAKDFIVNYQENGPALAEHGFVPTENTSFSFVQPSVWNKDYTMTVFDKVETAEAYLPTSLVEYLGSTKEAVSIVVSNGPDLVFTSKEQNAIDNEQQTQEQSGVSTTALIIGVILALLLCLVVIALLYRRQKRQS